MRKGPVFRSLNQWLAAVLNNYKVFFSVCNEVWRVCYRSLPFLAIVCQGQQNDSVNGRNTLRNGNDSPKEGVTTAKQSAAVTPTISPER
ncbi:unnamed protein product [Soboliphyme baturini]|uniref:Uncharacterized protein n=1 Tax=Soboliphyme baturini TaxID=241478 RepID=A0A183I9X3_9BILA|nr:unnamed protein product [Soboliphyme baturini]